MTLAVFGAVTACGAGDASGPAAPAIAHVEFRVSAIGGAVPGGTYVLVSNHAAAADSIALGIDRTATLTLEPGDSVDVVVRPSIPDDFYTSASSLRARADTVVDVILLPKRWTVQYGSHQGVTVPIDLVRATELGGDSVYLNHFAPVPTMLTTWAPSAFPLHVGLDTSLSARRWTASDSAFFWAAADRFSAAVGQQMFTPWHDGDLASGVVNLRIHFPFVDTIGPQTSLGINRSVCTDNLRLCTTLQAVVDIPEAMLMEFPGTPLETAREAGNTHTIEHELMHALGFGHGCFWPSIMMHTGTDCAATLPMDPSEYDVAYIELVQSLAGELIAHPTAWNLAEARP